MTDKIIPPVPLDGNDISSVVNPDLKALREAKGLSLKDIYDSTRISVTNLSAIENGQYHLLPAPVYARTFIRSYALAIGTESDILLAAYERYLQSLNAPLQEKETGSVWRKAARYGKGIIWFLAAAIVVIAIFVLLSRNNRPGPEVAQTPPTAPVQTAPDIKPEVQPEAPRPVPEKKYHLSMEAQEPVWVRIRGDEDRSEQMILQAGQTLERSANDPFTVDIGNAGGITLTFQGKPVGSIGKRGQVVHLRFPED